MIMANQAKHNNNMLFLRNLIEKSLLLKNPSFINPLFNFKAATKITFSTNNLSKMSIKK